MPDGNIFQKTGHIDKSGEINYFVKVRNSRAGREIVQYQSHRNPQPALGIRIRLRAEHWELSAANYIAFLISYCLETESLPGRNLLRVYELHSTPCASMRVP